MRELSAEARLHFYARSLSRRAGTGMHLAALCSAFAVIAAIVFGTLSVHPFQSNPLAGTLERRNCDPRISQSLAQHLGDLDGAWRIPVNADGIHAHLHALACY
jgi:hypothetical protein